MLHGSEERVRKVAAEMRALGVDRVRITASWFVVAPERDSRSRPGFNPADPRAYQEWRWGRLDRAIKAVVSVGLKPMLDLAFFAPRWAVKRGAADGDHRWRPSATEFGRFAEAAARRYNGGYEDPDHRGVELPAVRLWTTWNEPNHASFLLPQWERKPGRRGGWRPESPHIYRRMHEAAYGALKKVNEKNRVLVGGTSYFGGDRPGPRQNVAPLRFLRELACVDRRFRPLRRRECRGFRPLRADGYAHHPYSFYDPPNVGDPRPDNVQIADLGRLASTLARLHQRGRIAQSLPIYVTEYGYETNPPDTVRGVTLDQQASYLSEATYLAWRQAQVRMYAQFLFRDVSANEGDYQTGLETHDGQPKPALSAFRLPFWLEPAVTDDGTEGVFAFGQVRPGSGPRQITIESLAPDGSWVAVPSLPVDNPSPEQECPTFATDAQGFFNRFLRLGGDHGQTLRAVWQRIDATPIFSHPVTLNRERPRGRLSEMLRPPGP